MIARAWAWLRQRTWLLWLALGAALSVAVQFVLRRPRVTPAAPTVDLTKAARAEGRAEAYEEQGRSARAEVERIAAEIREADEVIAEADEGPSIEEVSDAKERASILNSRGL